MTMNHNAAQIVDYCAGCGQPMQHIAHYCDPCGRLLEKALQQTERERIQWQEKATLGLGRIRRARGCHVSRSKQWNPT